MTIQEAYNKGLDDAENNVIENLIGLLNEQTDTHFLNPRLEIVRNIIKIRSDYYHSLAERSNNIGKTFKKRVIEQKEELDNLK
jgi:hypothetical protein